MLNMVLLFIGTTEIIVIGGIALLIFGGKKLPELMRGLGKGVKEFKEGMNEVKEKPEEIPVVVILPQRPKYLTKEEAKALLADYRKRYRAQLPSTRGTRPD